MSNETEEDIRAAQLAESRAEGGKIKSEKKETKKTGLLGKIFKNPLVQFLIPSLGETLTGGVLPGWTGFVIWTYFSEKKSGPPPNLAEYITVGILAIAADALDLLALTGVFLLLTFPITLSCGFILGAWRFYKHGTKSAMPSKTKKP
jgi:hypothetical protein